jgi:diguanylate cyclase (GGDEF)-like protein
MNDLKLYASLSGPRGPRSYIGKILLVAFLGTHIPLLTLLAHFIITASLSAAVAVHVLVVALIATLIGTGITLWALHSLLMPIQITSRGLRQYLLEGTVPTLPTDFGDDAGILMADTHHTIQKVDSLIQTLANYDDLTGLPKRNLFLDRLPQTLIEKRRREDLAAIMVLDISGLSGINNQYGRNVGDLLLKAVADRLSRSIREDDLFSRIGNDEFALLQTGIVSLEEVNVRAERLLKAVGELPFPIDGHTIIPSFSLGIAVFPSDAQTPQELLQNAEIAQRQRNSNTRGATGNYSFYSAELNEKLRRQLELETDLRGALDRGELALNYQPQVDNRNGQVVGVEALLRWKHPRLGLISPCEFIPIAERTDLIFSIGEWVLRTACAQNKAWQDQDLPPFRMGINLSARQFQHPDLVEVVARVIQETGIAPQWIDLEVTESLAMDDVDQSVKLLQRLRGLGVSLSLDDFGTGYSSLSYLKRLPVDTLKIDRSFIAEVSDDKGDASITSTIIALAQSMNLSVIAEGVENNVQLNYLRSKGCGLSQGFLFSRPLPAEALTSLLKTNYSFLDYPLGIK